MPKSIPDKSNLKELPIFFIIGRERSGTTLLRTLFDAHPNVSIPIEFHFIWLMYNKYYNRKTWTIQQLENFYKELICLPRFHLLTIDKEKLHQDLISMAGENNYSTICKTVLANYISFFDKKELLILGDKCPVYAVHIKKILKAFPEAQIIHLTRDYRDNVLSMLRANIESHVFSSLVYRWKYYNRKVKNAAKVFPDSFITIRYEDLVSDPTVNLKKICNFLKLPYIEETLEFYKKKDDFMRVYPKGVFESIHSNLFKPVSADHVFVWKKKMGPYRVRLADSIVGADAEFWGYERVNRKRDWFLLFLNWPGLAYGRLYFLLGNLVGMLPLSLKVRTVLILAALFSRRWRHIKLNQERNAG
jgi:hypothetical protein